MYLILITNLKLYILQRKIGTKITLKPLQEYTKWSLQSTQLHHKKSSQTIQSICTITACIISIQTQELENYMSDKTSTNLPSHLPAHLRDTPATPRCASHVSCSVFFSLILTIHIYLSVM